MADDVQLTDLEVIQRFSLAVRGATASREEVVAALESDLAWLTGRRPAVEEPDTVAAAPARAPRKTAKRAAKTSGTA